MPRVVIVVKTAAKGKKVLSCYDPHSGREIPAGSAGPNQEDVDRTIRRIKEQLEKNGNEVMVKVMADG